MASKKYDTRQLTAHLRELAAEAHEWTMAEGALSRGEALAKLLFNKALGWTEAVLDDEGRETRVTHKPESWAIQLIYDRLEGKTPQAAPEDEGRMTALDHVRDLAKVRLNSLVPAVGGPPEYKPRKPDAE